jgi:hypothetical protein
MRGLNIKRIAFKNVFRLSTINAEQGGSVTRVLNEIHSQAMIHLHAVWMKLNDFDSEMDI